MILKCLVAVAILACMVIGDDLPEYFLKCKKSDPYLGQCVAASTNKAMNYFSKGDPEYNIPSLTPLVIPLISISSHGIMANLSDAVVDGISDSKILNADLDFEGKHFAFIIKTPVINIMSKYSIYGRFLMLPIIVNGSANITFDKLNMKFSFTYDLVEVNGEEYVQLTNATLIYAFENISIDLENLSSIGTATESEIDELFSKNIFGINEEIGLKIGEAIGEAVAKMLNNLFQKVPFNKLFDE